MSGKVFQEIAKHNASSPLLRLPQEVKEMIYEHVTGATVVLIRDIFEIRHENDRSVVLDTGNWYGLFWSISESWERLVRFHKDRSHMPNPFYAYRGHDASLDLGFMRVCTQLTKEMNHLLFRNYILRFTNAKALGDFYTACFLHQSRIGSDIRYLALFDNVKDRHGLVNLANMFSRIPEEFPNLRAIALEINFEGYEDAIKNMVPFKTPEQIEFGMTTNTRKHCHDRILQTVIKLSEKPLISAEFSFGGGDVSIWTPEQVAIWSDYVARKLGKSDQKEKEWKAYVDGLGKGVSRRDSRIGR